LVTSEKGKAQSLKDTLQLPEFELTSKYVLENNGFKKVKIDSSIIISHLNSDLSTLLSQYTTIFIKSYGNGTLATPSFRGTTAQHTQVEWNGIDLNSPMLGQADLSLIPVSQFDGLEILFGSAGISRTSGAFGGVINLVTNPDWNNRLNILASQSIGSFDTYTTNINIITGTSSFQSHSKFNYASALNNYPYYNDFLMETVNQHNASYKQFGFSEEVFWKLKDRHLFSAKLRYNYDDRNLPPTTTKYEANNVEKNVQSSLMAVVEYKYVKKDFNLSVRSAFANQKMHYTLDSTYDDHHQYYSWINKIKFTYIGIKKLAIKPGIDFTHDEVNSEEYEGIKTRNTTSVFTEINYTPWEKLKTSLVLREDLIDGKFLPLVPAVGVDLTPFQKLNLGLNLNLSRNYKYPTLNDLFWNLYGNPDLRPETNYSIEIGSVFNFLSKSKKFYIELNLTGYYSWIYDMITWSPVDGNSNLWKPENIDEILARGIESGINIKWEIVKFKFKFDNNYSFCKSTYEKASSEYDNKIGKQLIYIPVNTLNSTLTLERWKFYLIYNFSFTGERFTGKDNLTVMPGYSLSNIIFGKNLSLNNFILSLQLQVNNLFNLDYQSVASRPMPGINYAFTIKLSFDKPNRE